MNTKSTLRTAKIIQIEYLRGIAVCLVFFFHLKILKIGFVGVDVFFLLSGYVITGSLFNKKLNYKNIFLFYINRINRILPTLTLVFLITALIALFYFPLGSFEYGEILRQGLHSLVFLSNYLFFFSEVNYFGEEFSDFFLHTWSLSIEMQIYFIFPFISLFLVKIKNDNNFIFLIYLSIFIYFICIFQKDQSFIGGYYSPIIRFFEFFFGALFFLYENKFNKKNYINYITILSIFIFSTFLFFFLKLIDKSFFLISCFVFLTIIFINFKHKVYLIFKVFFLNLGKISYSFYLWHLPVIFFCLLFFNNKFYFSISAFLITFILSKLSFNYIEKKSILKNGKIYKIYFIFCTIFCISIFSYILINVLSAKLQKKNYDFFDNIQLQRIEKFSNDKNFLSKKIKEFYDISNFSNYVKIGNLCSKENYEIKECSFLLNEKFDNFFLLTGDSHAKSMISAFYNSEIISKIIIDINQGRHFSKDIIRITKNENKNIQKFLTKNKKDNKKKYQRIFKNFKTENNYQNKYLVIFNRNLHYLNKNDNYIVNDNFTDISKGQLKDLTIDEYLKYYSIELVNLTKQMSDNEKIIYILPIIDPKISLKDCLFKNMKTSLKNCYFLNNLNDVNFFEKSLKKIEQNNDKFILINLNDLICKKTQEYCNYISDDNTLIFQDSNHLSHEFSEKLSKQLDKILLNKLN